MSNEKNKLAYEIASSLEDMEALALYDAFTKKYSEAFLRKILLRVMSVPDHKIKRTRGALFTFLVQQHGGRSWD